MLFWGFNFISLKVLFEVMTPGAIMFWRYVVMGICLVTICKISGYSLKIPQEHKKRLMLAGFNSMGIYMILFIEGTRLTYAAEAAIILASNPVMVAVWTMLLKIEPKSANKVMGGLLALFGVALVVFGRPHGMAGEIPFQQRLVGDLLLLASAFSWAWSVVTLKPISDKIEPLPLFTMSMLGGLPVVVLYGTIPALNAHFVDMKAWHWFNFAQICLGSGAVAMVFYYKGMKKLPASTAAMHQFMVPVLATLFAALILHERLAWVQAIGVAVLLGGLLVAMQFINLGRRPTEVK